MCSNRKCNSLSRQHEYCREEMISTVFMPWPPQGGRKFSRCTTRGDSSSYNVSVPIERPKSLCWRLDGSPRLVPRHHPLKHRSCGVISFLFALVHCTCTVVGWSSSSSSTCCSLHRCTLCFTCIRFHHPPLDCRPVSEP